jgi:hypothetical protein
LSSGRSSFPRPLVPWNVALRRPKPPEGNMLQSQGIAASAIPACVCRVFSFVPGVRNRTQCPYAKGVHRFRVSFSPISAPRPAQVAAGAGRVPGLEVGFAEAGLVRFLMPPKTAMQHALRSGCARDAGTMRYLERVDERRATGAVARERSVSLGALGNCLLCQLSQRAAAFDRAGRGRMQAGLRAMPGAAARMQDGVRRPSDYHKVLKKRLRRFWRRRRTA